MKHEMKVIAHIRSDFPTKFGIPRQSGLTEMTSVLIFEPEYRNEAAFRGLEGFSHLWLIWQFSEAERKEWSPTVRPPRLGGNKRMGVFATRSPYRPNPIGLSSVRLLGISYGAEGPVLTVSGADLMDGTPIYDIKPYLSFTDSHPEAVCGFAEQTAREGLEVSVSESLLAAVPEEKREGLISLLSQDPRPHYIDDPEREFGFAFSGLEVHFTVKDGILTVTDIF